MKTYTAPITPGSYNKQALKIHRGTVAVHEGKWAVRGEKIAECEVGIEMGRGIVDPGWAKGKKRWW